MTEWEPATEAEAAMRDALRSNDQEGYFGVLARIRLLLPVAAQVPSEYVATGWGTWTTGGRTHILAFTSEEALRTCLAQHSGPARSVTLAELAAVWPNLEWWLAVNPGLPIEGYLPAWYVAQLARGDARLPGWTIATGTRPAEPVRARATVPGTAAFTPANEVEQRLLIAARAGDSNTVLSTLLLAKVLLPQPNGAAARPGDHDFPWYTEIVDGETCVVAFTSPERLTEHHPQPVATATVGFAQLIRHWPNNAWSLAINPGTPVSVRLIGNQIVALAGRAAEVGLGEDPDEAPAAETAPAGTQPQPAGPTSRDPGQQTIMQKVVPPQHVAYYLERGYDRVSGFVHRLDDVGHLTAPDKLIDALGLGYPGSSFSRDAKEIYVLRWPAYRPNLYRIPYGGQDEAAMRAMEGWVIERPPFRGNGFAPGDSGDVIAEFKVDSVCLPHGAQLWRIADDGTERIEAILDSDTSTWHRVGGA